jgi:hypothetical protein
MPSDKFGSGDYAFLNYSNTPIGLKIDGSQIVVPKGKCSIFSAEIKAKGAKNRSIVCYQQEPDGKWAAQPFFSSRLIVQAGVRNLILISQDPRTKAIDFRGVADFVKE